MKRLMVSGLLAIASQLSSPCFGDEQAAAAYNAEHGGVSLVVMRHSEVVFEAYANGGKAENAYLLASGTKSFCGIIAAAAVMDGLLTLDEPISATLAEWRDDGQKSGITLRQLLTLTSGLDTPRPPNPISYSDAVELPLKAEPGSDFTYGPAAFQVFGEVMRRKLAAHKDGQYAHAVDYLEARIFEPLGIEAASWRMRDGFPQLNAGAALSARDWAQFGSFVLAGGLWKDEQLVDPEALSEIQSGTLTNPGYGLTWWLNDVVSPDILSQNRTMRFATDIFAGAGADAVPHDLFMAAGAGGQRLYVIPSLDMVVVRQTDLIGQRVGRIAPAGGLSSDELLRILMMPPDARRATLRAHVESFPPEVRRAKIQEIRSSLQGIQRGRRQEVGVARFSDIDFLTSLLAD